MIVTQRQLAAIRTGKVTTAFLPQSRTKRWEIEDRIYLRRLVEREENYRKSVPVKGLGGENEGASVSVTLKGIGDPMPFADISLAAAKRAGFRTLEVLKDQHRELYTFVQLRELIVAVVFALGDDRPRLMVAKAHTLSTEDYTSSPRKAMRGEPEAMPLRRAA